MVIHPPATSVPHQHRRHASSEGPLTRRTRRAADGNPNPPERSVGDARDCIPISLVLMSKLHAPTGILFLGLCGFLKFSDCAWCACLSFSYCVLQRHCESHTCVWCAYSICPLAFAFPKGTPNHSLAPLGLLFLLLRSPLWGPSGVRVQLVLER